MAAFFLRELPAALAPLEDLALDLRWTWNHEADALWKRIDAETWNRTRNPWTILQNASTAHLSELAADRSFLDHLERLAAARRAYLARSGWFGSAYGAAALAGVAFFSMEFGLSDALPLYAGGLGILAGDFLKTASDLGVPAIGIGLLFQEGYFRQTIDATGWQHEANPYNEPATMPIRPVLAGDGPWLRIPLELPGRTLFLRVWTGSVGRATLYLLDSNDPLNSPVDRGITGKLYDGGTETRLLQELVLGIGGWRTIETVRPEIEVCHINEGHAALVVLERARRLAQRLGIGFWEAWSAARAGTVFTTHTPVAAGFDRYPSELIGRYLRVAMDAFDDAGVAMAEILALGRADQDGAAAPFNMAYLAVRSSLASFGVSRLHGRVSRHIFQPLFPRWPNGEVPVDHVTNGIHVPSWDSAQADRIWTAACGKDRWRTMSDALSASIEALSDEALWEMRGDSRKELVRSVRARLKTHLGSRGLPAETVAQASAVLDPNILTLGFARRFAAYKRPNLLLHDAARFGRLLANARRPAQIVVAGKAHPDDDEGKRMIREWIAFAQRPGFRHRVVFLEDYDITLAEDLVKGVDVWINTPRRPWEACGTSGMKILANGGLNLSELDGWWEEAYAPDLGWAIDGGESHEEHEQDALDAEALYATLERQVASEFYDRDAGGMPRAWLARIRRSMAALTPQYCSTRMVHEYIAKAYLPAAQALRERLADAAAGAKAITQWEHRVRRAWASLHIGATAAARTEDSLIFSVPIYLGEMAPDDVRIELYADPRDGDTPEIIELARGEPIAGAVNSYVCTGRLPATRSPDDFTVRIVPHHAGVRIPTELALILWQK
ncbi:MAG TPA: alpha-glucan family phosphorylase [Stellaceae bacterium]|nr:alpha-glucan family phosphorylase [Stellaceae bacterium]